MLVILNWVEEEVIGELEWLYIKIGNRDLEILSIDVGEE